MFDATVGGSSSNSYTSLAEADAYHGDMLYGDAWAALDDTQKQKALVLATAMLDVMSWTGMKASTTQALRWPRLYVTDEDGVAIDSDIIPEDIKKAAAELALNLSSSQDVATGDPIKKIVVDVIELEFNVSGTVPEELPSRVNALIRKYLSGSRLTAKLVRV